MNENKSALLKALVDLRDRQIQKARIQFGGRVSALERGADDGAGSKQLELVTRWHDRFAALEAELDQDISDLVKEIADEEPLFEQLLALKGLGEILVAKLIAPIDIERAPQISSLWRYCGYGVIDGKRERSKGGETRHFNGPLKVTLWLIARSFMRCNSPYRKIYDSAKEHFKVKHPDWSDGHCHNAALGNMIKIFLSHLWLRWRTLEGLPIPQPYVQEHLGHTHIYKPEEFGWPAMTNEG